jgi:hypothetical protein
MPYSMKLCKAALSVLALLLLAGSRGEARAQATNPPADAPSWQRVTSDEYRFTVLMPSEPAVRNILDTPEGTTTRQFFVLLDNAKGAYMVRIQRALTGYSFPAVPDGVAERYARAVDITLDSQRTFTFAGVPAREALLHDMTIRHRVIWLAANNSLYVIGAAGRGEAFQSAADARRFFESFQLIGTH